MAAVRSILFALIFYPATILWAAAGIIGGLAGPKVTLAVVMNWVDLHHWLTVRLLGIRARIEGNIPDGAYLIAVKHQSMFETIEMLRYARFPVIVLKRELSRIPIFGWVTRLYGVIPVDRSAGAKALRQMVARGREAVAANRPILIYPEGTRVLPGQSPPLRPGFAGLYRALGLPVLPVALDSGRVWGRGLVKQSGTVTIRVGEVLPAGMKRDEIERAVHSAINALELAPKPGAELLGRRDDPS